MNLKNFITFAFSFFHALVFRGYSFNMRWLPHVKSFFFFFVIYVKQYNKAYLSLSFFEDYIKKLDFTFCSQKRRKHNLHWCFTFDNKVSNLKGIVLAIQLNCLFLNFKPETDKFLNHACEKQLVEKTINAIESRVRLQFYLRKF